MSGQWLTVKLRDIACKVGSGATPRGGKKAYITSGIPLIRSLNIHFYAFQYDGLAFLTEAQAKELDNAVTRSGDVLLNITGASIGRANQCPPDLDGARVNQHVCIIRPQSEIDPGFLRWFLASPSQQSMIFEIESGVTRQALTKEMILNFDVPMPPIAEQRRIVQKIEELFSKLDAGVAALERIGAALKRYRAAVLKAAVEGKLTADWRAHHPAKETGGELLRRILDERRRKWEEEQRAKYAKSGKQPPKGWQAKYKEPTELNTSELPALPADWCWATVDQLLGFLRNGLSQKPLNNPPGHPILRINAVRPMKVDLEEIRYLNPPPTDAAGYLIEDGDLLFTRYNGSLELLGVAGLVRRCSRPILHPDKLIRAKTVLREPLPGYLELACNTGISRQHMTRRARTTAGQTGISGNDIREMPVPLPPLAEQEAIITEVDRRLSVVDEIEMQIDASLKRVPAAAEHSEARLRGPAGAARPARRAGGEAAGADSG